MKKKLKYIIISIIVLAVIIASIFAIIGFLNDEDKITVDEKKWINANLSNLQNVNVINNVDVFGNNGYGVFFDYINDFSKEYSVKINPITYNMDEFDNKDGFKLTHDINDNSVVFYDDYYVLVGKNNEHINDFNSITDNIGNIASDYTYLSSYLKRDNLVSYNSYGELQEAFETGENIKYMIVPRMLYLSYTIKNNCFINYYFGDIKTYFIYDMKKDDVFSSILKKYFSVWKKENLEKSINSNLLNTLTSNLDLSEKDLSSIRSKVYKYGFVNNSPYEVLISGNYGGIISVYLEKFSDLTGVEFEFNRYKNFTSFNNAITNKEIDLYFNYYDNNSDYKSVDTGMNINYVIVANNTNGVIINSLNSLQYKNVYVLENSILNTALSKIGNVNIITYKSTDDLKKAANKDSIILLDRETYDYMANQELDGFTVRYANSLNTTYNFKVTSNEAFYKLFNKYVMIQNPESVRLVGLYNHKKAVTKGSIFGRIAQYLLIIIISIVVILYFVYRSSKKIKISKKIKKEDKIKFIDQLTSLKNRNYLNENIDGWNKNKIYPQSTVIIDLNRVQEINDTKGYDEGDKQIKAASNILIRTQLDNSDIMRTDGNEFLVYTVGYDKRAIESYIRKLIKEFKSLPFDYGAIITYSMIENELITIEDAINDAVDKMKEKKQEI